MIRHSCAFGAIMLLASFLPGCGTANEKEAKITGTVDTSSNLSPQEAKGRMQGMSPNSMPKNYNPGSNRR